MLTFLVGTGRAFASGVAASARVAGFAALSGFAGDAGSAGGARPPGPGGFRGAAAVLTGRVLALGRRATRAGAHDPGGRGARRVVGSGTAAAVLAGAVG